MLECIQNNTNTTYRSKYFLPSGIEQFAPQLLIDEQFYGQNDIQPILAKNHRGYYFEFQQSDSVVFNQQTDCARHGYKLGAYQLCLKDVGTQQIAACKLREF